MKNKKLMTTSFFLLGLLFNFGYDTRAQATSQINLNQEELEKYLRTAKIISVQKNEQTGRTSLWRIQLDNGQLKLRGYFKHLNRHRPSFLADSYQYEIAAYELSKLLDLEIIPPVVEREIEGITGSLQLFMEDCIRESERKRRNIEPPDPEGFKNKLEVLNVFENLVFEEECFDADDTLIHLKDWKVCRVDFSMAFSPTPALIPGCTISRCSRHLYLKFLQLDDSQVKDKLGAYLSDDEMEALLKRKEIIIAKIEQLIKEKGEEAVLF